MSTTQLAIGALFLGFYVFTQASTATAAHLAGPDRLPRWVRRWAFIDSPRPFRRSRRSGLLALVVASVFQVVISIVLISRSGEFDALGQLCLALEPLLAAT